MKYIYEKKKYIYIHMKCCGGGRWRISSSDSSLGINIIYISCLKRKLCTELIYYYCYLLLLLFAIIIIIIIIINIIILIIIINIILSYHIIIVPIVLHYFFYFSPSLSLTHTHTHSLSLSHTHNLSFLCSFSNRVTEDFSLSLSFVANERRVREDTYFCVYTIARVLCMYAILRVHFVYVCATDSDIACMHRKYVCFGTCVRACVPVFFRICSMYIYVNIHVYVCVSICSLASKSVREYEAE